VLPRGEREESELVARLSRVVDEKLQTEFSEDWKKQQQPMLNEMQRLMPDSSADRQRMKSLLDKLGDAEAEEFARLDGLKATRREAALRLSYLRGDDAVRAKVRALLADEERGNDDTGLIMLRGLAHSRNLQLQMELLQAAWDDVERVPTGLLQSGLQQSKAFLQHKTIDLYYSGGVPGRTLPHAEVVEEFRRELAEIVASLPQRTGANRQRTAYFLMMAGGGPDAEQALRVRAVIAEEFAGMSESMKTMLLQDRWKKLCDPALPRTSEPLESACAAARPDNKR